MFPPYITTVEDAIDFLPIWAERIGGTLRDGIDATAPRPGIIDVDDFHIDFIASGTVLTVAISFSTELIADYYKFDLRRIDGTLLWREDNHPGHAQQHGGPHHLHIGPEEDHRIPANPATLTSIAKKVVITHLSIE
ncbi:MAG: hypothetical protein BGO26_15085 [Actinobacteria bacterium 69-20]|nr:hypothetical protein [Actinomycetota bacterium]OJV29613.1 MAG: hypothetical protein BGO26_15085 [Actinobacteria bacterium 69-20]